MLSPWAMRQERMLARQTAASILSLGPSHLSLSSSFLPLSRLACTICGSWVDECGGMERDWETVLLSHSNWGKNLAYVLMHALPPPLLSFSLCLTVSLYNRLHVFLSIIFSVFSLPPVVLFFFLSLAWFFSFSCPISASLWLFTFPLLLPAHFMGRQSNVTVWYKFVNHRRSIQLFCEMEQYSNTWKMGFR